jgi:hypothetical protein
MAIPGKEPFDCPVLSRTAVREAGFEIIEECRFAARVTMPGALLISVSLIRLPAIRNRIRSLLVLFPSEVDGTLE